MRKLLVALVLVIGVQGEARAAKIDTWMNGTELHQYCDGENIFRTSVCLGFVVGAVDAINVVASSTGRRPLCIPTEVTRLQLVDVIKRYLDHHPEERHQTAAALVLYAISDHWPCD